MALPPAFDPHEGELGKRGSIGSLRSRASLGLQAAPSRASCNSLFGPSGSAASWEVGATPPATAAAAARSPGVEPRNAVPSMQSMEVESGPGSNPVQNDQDTGIPDTWDPDRGKLHDTRAEEWDREKYVLENLGWVVFMVVLARAVAAFAQWLLLGRLMVYTFDGACDPRAMFYTCILSACLVFRNILDKADDEGGTRLTTRFCGWPKPPDPDLPQYAPRVLHVMPMQAWMYVQGRDIIIILWLVLGNFYVAPTVGDLCHKYYDVAVQDVAWVAGFFLLITKVQDCIFAFLFCLQHCFTERVEPMFLKNRRGSQGSLTSVNSAGSIQDEHLHEASNTKECEICEKPFLHGDEVHITPCKHMFHRECLELRLKTTHACPTCHADLSKKGGQWKMW